MKNINSDTERPIQYTILDPSGNITALVESPVEISRQPHVADAIMKKHREVEQVGFVSFPDYLQTEGTAAGKLPDAILRMAGGEFCGNASMCTGALFVYRQAERKDLTRKILLKVSGTENPVEVDLTEDSQDRFQAGIVMPPISGIQKIEFDYFDPCDKNHNQCSGTLPVVNMEGISHIIIEQDSSFYSFFENPRRAEEAIRIWCKELSSTGLGLLFLNDISSDDKNVRTLTPLVYIPGNDTLFWENSCASGSAAAAYYLAKKTGKAVSLTLSEPGGELQAESNPGSGETRIRTTVRIISHEKL